MPLAAQSAAATRRCIGLIPDPPASAVALRGMPLHELPRDDDALQLVRALPDREQRRIAVVALDVDLLRVAVRAVYAHRLQAVLERGLGGEELGHPGLHVATHPRVVGARGGLDQQARGFDARRHVRELDLYRLVLGD